MTILKLWSAPILRRNRTPATVAVSSPDCFASTYLEGDYSSMEVPEGARSSTIHPARILEPSEWTIQNLILPESSLEA